MAVGIIAALPAEGECLAGTKLSPQTAHDLGDGTRLQLAGLGPVNAAAAATSLLKSGCSCLVSWGMAAGLDPDLEPGRICVPSRIVTETGASFEASTGWRTVLLERLSPMNPVSGALYQSSQVVTTAREKSRIREQSQAVALDMESGAIAEIATRAGSPFLVIRAISDDASMSLPEAARDAVDQSGRLQLESFLRRMLKSPGDLGRVWNTSKGYFAAKRALRHAARLAGSTFSAPVEHQTEEGII